MAKNKKDLQKKNQKVSKKYNNPLQTVWGKILIVLLSLLMVAGILASFIYLIVKAFMNV